MMAGIRIFGGWWALLWQTKYEKIVRSRIFWKFLADVMRDGSCVQGAERG